jgi:hypothetical protein
MSGRGHKLQGLVGKKFGRLIVLSEVAERYKNRAVQWKCKCDCGKIKIAIGSSLKDGHTQSCGCLQKETSRKNAQKRKEKNRTITLLKRKYNAIKMRHNKKFDKDSIMDFDAFCNIVSQNCFYCGTSPMLTLIEKSSDTTLKINGIDRIDHKEGYTVKNSLPCCSCCNYAKRKMSIPDFKSHIEKIYRHFIVKQNGLSASAN